MAAFLELSCAYELLVAVKMQVWSQWFCGGNMICLSNQVPEPDCDARALISPPKLPLSTLCIGWGSEDQLLFLATARKYSPASDAGA